MSGLFWLSYILYSLFKYLYDSLSDYFPVINKDLKAVSLLEFCTFAKVLYCREILYPFSLQFSFADLGTLNI